MPIRHASSTSLLPAQKKNVRKIADCLAERSRGGLFETNLGSFVTRLVLVLLLSTVYSLQVRGQCTNPANAIVAENCLPGNPDSEWDVSTGDGGDPSIQGFATDISVNQGSTVFFKIKTDARAYTINIYRMGYYGGMGARKVASIRPSATLPQTQPACLTDPTTNLVDCGNWVVSASWQVPVNATSGIYFAHLIRSDTGGDSHIVFIVRNDTGHSAILFQTGDESWQAYNYYGGGSLYGPPSATFDLNNRAFKVSYNRPFLTRSFGDESATWVFGSEYPMVRWLESNGYDVTYFTGVDAARNGGLIKNHKVYLTSGHDEYWSGPQRASVEAARDAGVNMAFFTGNEVFWKTRWENSIDGSNTAFRTMACYKETYNGTGTLYQKDPNDPSTWTGTWRDPSMSPPADGGRPENALTGTLFTVNGPGSDNNGSLSIQVPAADGKMRFWRNTAIASLAPSATYTLPSGTLGYEWDEDVDNGARPAGAFPLSTTTYTLTSDLLLDFGATYGAGKATHHLMTYRAPSGALVFGAGTVQWAWGLDNNHDNPFGFDNLPPDRNMQQATVNLLADMGVQPATLQTGLLPATASTDKIAPSSSITAPASGGSVTIGNSVTITGTAVDGGGGVVAGVEVSGDGGSTWHPATGRQNWTYTWTPGVVGNTTIFSRAVDDSGNLEAPSSGVTINVMEHDCPCNGYSASVAPAAPDSGDGGSIEVGVKFRADYDGYITGIRFYKSSSNTGTHIGNLWSSSGALLATATFTGESGSGWQQVNFSSPVAISANTTYIASYFAPAGHYAATAAYFATSGMDMPPIHFLRNGVDGSNGVYAYSSFSKFPASSFSSTNYWVDVVYMPATSMANAPPALAVVPGSLTLTAYLGNSNSAGKTVTIYNQGSSTLNWSASTSAPWLVLSATAGTTTQTISISANPSGLAAGTYTGTVTFTAPGITNGPQTVPVTLTVTNLLLSSNFAAGAGLQGWVNSPLGGGSNWAVANQVLQYSGTASSQLFAGNSAWTNYTVNAAFKLSNLLNYPGGIRGRVNPSTGAGYMVWVYPAQSQIILYRASAWDINQPLAVLGQASGSFDTTNFHNLSLVFQGSQIQVEYDGKAIITATDSTYPSGLIALEGLNQPVAFQSVLVTSPSANTGTLSTTSSSLTFSATYGGPNPAAQTVQIAGGGGGTLAWTAAANAPWLSVSAASGVTPASLQMSANSSALTGGTYSGTITLTSLGAAPTTQTIAVSLTVVTPPPAISVSASSFNFVAITGQPTPAQTLSVVNSGYGTFGYMASTDAQWLVVSPASGTTPGNVSTSINASGLAVGTYTGHVVITASGVPNSPVSVPVNLQVLSGDLNETFANAANGWIISPMGLGAGWSVSNGVYSYSGLGLSQSCTGNSSWSNYMMDAHIKLSSLSNWPGGIRARVNPSTGAGYAVWLYPGSGLAILYQVGQWDINGAVLKALAQAPLAFDTALHDLRISFNGSSISVSWDGTVIMTATDASYANGYVCLDADSQPISYSNITVGAVQNQVTLDPQSSLVFSALPGTVPAAQTVNITAAGASTAWTFTSSSPWLTATASATLTPGVLTVSANPTGMPEGTYTGTLTIYAPGASNSPLAIPVTLAVKTAVLSTAPASLTFFGAVGFTPPAQSITVSNLGSGNLGWTASNTSPWLTLGSTSGTAPATISVQPNANGPAVGTYNDTVTISSPDVANSPATIPVSLQVGTLLFSDTFSAGAGNWTISPLGFASGWSVVNQTYTYNGGGHTQSWAGNNNWADYTVATNFQLSSTSDYPGGLRGRVNTTTGASYGVWIYPAERILKLYRIGQWNIDAGNTLLSQSGAITIDTSVHNLRLSFQGSTIKVYYDNQLAITATDGTYTQGAIALDVSNQPIAFSNVNVIGF